MGLKILSSLLIGLINMDVRQDEIINFAYEYKIIANSINTQHCIRNLEELNQAKGSMIKSIYKKIDGIIPKSTTSWFNLNFKMYQQFSAKNSKIITFLIQQFLIYEFECMAFGLTDDDYKLFINFLTDLWEHKENAKRLIDFINEQKVTELIYEGKDINTIENECEHRILFITDGEKRYVCQLENFVTIVISNAGYLFYYDRYYETIFTYTKKLSIRDFNIDLPSSKTIKEMIQEDFPIEEIRMKTALFSNILKLKNLSETISKQIHHLKESKENIIQEISILLEKHKSDIDELINKSFNDLKERDISILDYEIFEKKYQSMIESIRYT